MDNNYTYAEQVDMLLIYGRCEGNGRASVRAYTAKFPNRRVPNHQTFASIERRLRENGSLKPRNGDRGRIRTVRTAAAEEMILNRVEENPTISTRRIEHELQIPKSTVHCVLKEHLLQPFHVQKVHELLDVDTATRLTFCRLIQNYRNRNIHFCKKILFTDEACFRRSGITNLHNEHVYSDENPHATKVTHFQHEFKINIWAGIINNVIVGPVVMPDQLNGNDYLNFLQQTLPDLLEDLPLIARQNMWFMHDGAPPHFTLAVRQHLHEIFPEHWIGRGNDAPIHWPARSPDLTPCDFFMWGAVKSKVYSSPVNNRQDF